MEIGTLEWALNKKEGPHGSYRFVLKNIAGHFAPFRELEANWTPVAEMGMFGWTPVKGLDSDTRALIQQFNRQAVRDALPKFESAVKIALPKTSLQIALDDAQATADDANEPVMVFESDGGKYLVRKLSETSHTVLALHVATVNPRGDIAMAAVK